MELAGFPLHAIDWAAVAAVEHPGEQGVATWRTVQAGAVRVRMVEYSAGFVANDWCEKGHVVLVIEGELVTELRDGGTHTVAAGGSLVVADGDGWHRSRSPRGARLFIVD